MMLRWFAVAGFLGGIGAAGAEPIRMSAADIKQVMQPGAVLAIDTPLRTVIPVKVDSSSMVSAEAGALGLTLGALKDRGRWWVDNDQLCMKWFRWFDAKPRCITLHREGTRVRWYENSGESGTATITEAPTAVAAEPRALEPRQPKKVVELVSAERRPAVVETREPSIAPEVINRRTDIADEGITSSPTAMPERERMPINAGAAEALRAPPAKIREPEEPRRQAAAIQPTIKKPFPAAKSAKVAAAVRKPVAKATAATSTVALTSFRVSRVVDGDILNVRSGPSEYHDAVGSIPARGRGVQIIGECRDLWCPIRHGNLKGWVNRYYLAEDAGQATFSKR